MNTKKHDNEPFFLQFVIGGVLYDESSYFENYQSFRKSVASIIDNFLNENGISGEGVIERFTEDYGYAVAWSIKETRMKKFWLYSFDGEDKITEFVESTLPLPEVYETQQREDSNE
ncbi:hypothetical protein HGO21_16600 [Acinetobacter sp. CUI P1]|nr:hypothetical protein [Acinetobacter sp. CUI P1]